LWDTFGGVQTERGYKLLDPHVGLIYGDSITLTRARDILVRLERKGFASGNVVLGIGSYTYQYLTRDTFGWALKATYAEVNGEPQELVKDPVTDSGVKKSAKGLLRVDQTPDGYVLHDQQTPEQAAGGALAPVFRDGELLVEQSLAEIRARLQGSWTCPEAGSIRWPAC
ncbi:MAG TPA: nicotinate phosphoribosyltransferase, partial [Achromobacter sp.]|nr:nicotinate phosphoribosyltransferase [Achromobacter sp.]